MISKKLKLNNKILLFIGIFFLLVSFLLNTYYLSIFNFLKKSFDIDSQNTIENIILYLPIISTIMIIQSYRTQYKIIWINNIIFNLLNILSDWWKHFVKSICKENGYLVVASLIGIYITLYSLVESKSSRDLTNKHNEYSTFISLVSAGNNITLQSAMSMFSDLYTDKIVIEPNLLNPLSWMEKDNPYKYQLLAWTNNYLSNCTTEKCGKEKYRIYLSDISFNNIELNNINFSNSNLKNIHFFDSHIYSSNFNNTILQGFYISNTKINSNPSRSTFINADMRGSTISKSNLRGTNFNGANFNRLIKSSSKSSFKSYFITSIKDSNLQFCTFDKANLSYVILEGTNIQGIDLSNTILTNINLNGAIYDKNTKFPKDFSISEFKMIKIKLDF